MNELCKNCKWRCELYWHGTGKIAADFVCFVQQDAGNPELPIQGDGTCSYYEEGGEE